MAVGKPKHHLRRKNGLWGNQLARDLFAGDDEILQNRQTAEAIKFGEELAIVRGSVDARGNLPRPASRVFAGQHKKILASSAKRTRAEILGQSPRRYFQLRTNSNVRHARSAPEISRRHRLDLPAAQQTLNQPIKQPRVIRQKTLCCNRRRKRINREDSNEPRKRRAIDLPRSDLRPRCVVERLNEV